MPVGFSKSTLGTAILFRHMCRTFHGKTYSFDLERIYELCSAIDRPVIIDFEGIINLHTSQHSPHLVQHIRVPILGARAVFHELRPRNHLVDANTNTRQTNKV